MPRIPFDQLPPDSRVWIFAADRPVSGERADRLLNEVDDFLETWAAHGEPLRAAREWRDDHFLVVGVDPNTATASGCSIDGMFRRLQGVERAIEAKLVGGGRVYYRDAQGEVRVATREEFTELSRLGQVKPDTPVFDQTLTQLDAWGQKFERPAKDSWAAGLMSA